MSATGITVRNILYLTIIKPVLHMGNLINLSNIFKNLEKKIYQIYLIIIIPVMSRIFQNSNFEVINNNNR